MLTTLIVRQFALMENVQLELKAGMTVFTGETGAGKSILVDALGAVFGARASADWVRHGAQRAEVIATWYDGEDVRISRLLHEQDIESEEEMILRRIISKDGRSRAYINGIPVALKVLQQLGDICLDLHGQHEHQALLQNYFQRELLDAGVQKHSLEQIRMAFNNWREVQQRLQVVQSQRSETEQQAEWMRSELSRLQLLSIEEGLTDALQSEVEAGRHHAQIQQAAAEALALLDEGEPSARGLIARAVRAVSTVEAFHAGLAGGKELIEQTDTLLSEVIPELRSVLDCSFDEAKLHSTEERLMHLHEAMRRHHRDETGLLALMAEWENRLSALDTAGWDEASLISAVAAASQRYRKAAALMSNERLAAGRSLTRELRPFLDRLALSGLQIRFDVEQQENESAWSRSGWDDICMKISSNPGEPWRQLSAVASGGELSRLILALKGCGALCDAPHIAVFDEVDSGIGGETAWCVGELLAVMGSERQVLVISHLPQVASCADAQIAIRKIEQEGRTFTRLEPVVADQRQLEIARMLGGHDADGLQHAERMLKRGRMAA
jgi:DNA repair protein RecN (Recombination protein N)